jgi:hypothetical protein
MGDGHVGRALLPVTLVLNSRLKFDGQECPSYVVARLRFVGKA